MRVALSAAVVLACLLMPVAARADIAFGRADVPTVFFISKSDDRNRVDYGIRLDERCRPRGDQPMVVYWRQFERGLSGRASHGLNFMEGFAYGIASAEPVARSESGATIRIHIRALPRAITVRTARAGEGCTATATTLIDGREALLESVHLTLAGPGSVRYADLLGRVGDQRVRERITP